MSIQSFNQTAFTQSASKRSTSSPLALNRSASGHAAFKRQAGFTLIELMVVIVIIGVMVSLVVLNIDGVDQRKAMQVREMLILDLKKINRESNDQARIYALQTQSMTDVSPFQYRLMEYQKQTQQPNQQFQLTQAYKWAEVPQFQSRSLPEKISLQIEAQEQRYPNANNSDLIGTDAPKLIWLGNGEVKPVTIQVYYEQKAVGAPINVDYLGKVDAQS